MVRFDDSLWVKLRIMMNFVSNEITINKIFAARHLQIGRPCGSLWGFVFFVWIAAACPLTLSPDIKRKVLSLPSA